MDLFHLMAQSLLINTVCICLYTNKVNSCAAEAIFCCPTENRSPRSLINIKRCAVQKGEGIIKKISEKSCNFGEIIKKLYSLWKMTILHSTGNTSVWTKEVGHSNTCGTVRLCSFPLKFTAAHSLHFQHLVWTKGYKFKTPTVKRSLVSIVHINS